MPTIEITEEQRERLEAVRAELEEHRLGPYGTIRTVDAVEFLLDHYETGAELGHSVEDEPNGDEAEGDDEPEGEDGGDEPNGDEAEGDDEPDEDDQEEDHGDETGEEEDEDGGDEADDDPGRLNAMMQLLEEHDDKWEESDTEDGKYAVTLPDDTTEHVRTKDDIRALLFKHY